jgi:hypothetical protein
MDSIQMTCTDCTETIRACDASENSVSDPLFWLSLDEKCEQHGGGRWRVSQHLGGKYYIYLRGSIYSLRCARQSIVF